MSKTEKTKSKAREIIEYIIVIGMAVALAFLVRFHVGQLFVVSGASMEPTFQNGDWAISSIISYHNKQPKHNEVVVVKADGLEGKKIIKRVIGVGGDTIEVKKGVLYRNGKKVEEPYIKEKMMSDVEKITVPKNHIYVMGDNRNNSGDSRLPEVGPLPLNKVQGKVVFEIWHHPFRTKF